MGMYSISIVVVNNSTVFTVCSEGVTLEVVIVNSVVAF